MLENKFLDNKKRERKRKRKIEKVEKKLICKADTERQKGERGLPKFMIVQVVQTTLQQSFLLNFISYFKDVYAYTRQYIKKIHGF